ncbi:hypothetical protein HK102_001772 [Quaeritorhiza haematococci]|nr:hypothetical protein HK102_001772 [Quaeritorhiza haematococci]
MAEQSQPGDNQQNLPNALAEQPEPLPQGEPVNHSADIQRFIGDMAELRGQVRALQAGNDALQASNHALQAQVVQLWERNDALQAGNDALQASHDALQASNHALQAELHNINRSNQAEFGKLDERLSMVESLLFQRELVRAHQIHDGVVLGSLCKRTRSSSQEFRSATPRRFWCDAALVNTTNDSNAGIRMRQVSDSADTDKSEERKTNGKQILVAKQRARAQARVCITGVIQV